MEHFTCTLETKIGNHKEPIFNLQQPNNIYANSFDQPLDTYDDGDEIIDAKTVEIDSTYLDYLDQYINAKVVIPGRDGIPVLAQVKRRKRDADGNPVGSPHSNPIFDSRVYELEFPDGRVEEYSTNVLVENLIAQTDNDGWDVGLLDEILDFRKDDSIAILKESGYITSANGQKKPIVTTKGWDELVKWKDQSTNWVPISLAKESNPVEVAEAAHGISQEPAFIW